MRPRAGLYDIVFALNLASSFGYVLLVSVIKRITSAPADDLAYLFFRAAARINHLLLLGPVPPVSTSDVERHMPGIREQLGRELVLLVSVCAAAAIVYLLLRLIAGTRVHRTITARLLGPCLLFAVPLSYLAVMHNVSWESPYYGVPSFWGVSYRTLVLILGAEGFAAIVIALATAVRSVPGWLLGTLWCLHVGFWVPALWSALPPWEMASFFGFFVAHALVIGWLLIAIIWVRRLRRSEPGMLQEGTRGMAWTVAAGVAAVGICAFIWLPHPVRSVAHPSRPESVTIELSRGPCYGLCPSYSVRVHANGSVEYTGNQEVRERGKATATLSTGQVTAILQKLEDAGFFGIEDSAFSWCFDTPGIAVAVSVDGITHRVASDSGEDCIGFKAGTQARFVRAAEEIDQIVGSRRWVK